VIGQQEDKEFMDMEIGPEVKRSAILKYRTRLKGLLAEHEYQAGQSEHLTFLGTLCTLVVEDITKHTDKYKDKTW
jgi:hypothetical protein